MNWTTVITKLVTSFFSVVIAWITYKQVTVTSETDRKSDELAELRKKIDSLEEENDNLKDKIEGLQTKNKLLKLQIKSLEQDKELEKEKIIQYKKRILELKRSPSEYE